MVNIKNEIFRGGRDDSALRTLAELEELSLVPSLQLQFLRIPNPLLASTGTTHVTQTGTRARARTHKHPLKIKNRSFRKCFLKVTLRFL